MSQAVDGKEVLNYNTIEYSDKHPAGLYVVRVNTHLPAYVCVWACVCESEREAKSVCPTQVHTQTRTRTQANTQTRTQANTQARTPTHAHTLTNKHTRTSTHTHAHT